MRPFKRFLYVLVFSGVLGAATHAALQAPPPPPAPPEQGNNGPPDTFAEARRSGQQRGAESLAGAGRAESLNGLRQVISANVRPRPWSFKVSGATPEELARQDLEAVAQFMATLGYMPRDVSPGAPGGNELIQSAARVVLGGASFADEVRVAPVVVVADLVSVTPDASIDAGYRSTATLRVVKSVKGDLTPGQTIPLRQRSGPDSQGYIQASGEFRPYDTGRYLLFLSPAAYELRSGRRGGPTPNYALVLATYKVNGQQLDPLGDIDHGPVPVSAIGGI